MTAFLAIAFILVFLWVTRQPRAKHDGLMPHTPDQRLHAWTDKMDAEFGTTTEQRLKLQARGGVAKRRLIQAMRNIAVRSDFQRRAREAQRGTVEIIERIGLSPPARRYIKATPLPSLASPTQVTPFVVPRARSKLTKYA